VLLTITTTTAPATDLGYLLAKNPGRTHSFELTFGTAHVFYPEATPERCTAALLVDIDAVGLVRGRPRNEDAPLAAYVNDRPYAASSFLSVAISRVFGTALGGRSRERQELADTPISLVATLHALPCRGGTGVVHRLFGPLGYTVEVEQLPLDPAFPGWGASRLHDVTLTGTCRLADLLTHIYVLVPVLDDQKHYWVGDDEIGKLLAHGEGWLAAHPERELIVERSLKHRGHLIRGALAQLLDEDAVEPPDEVEADAGEDALERGLSLNNQRLATVHRILSEAGAMTVADLGCGEGKLVGRLSRSSKFQRVLGVDVSVRTLERARQRLNPERMPAKIAERVTLLHGSAIYRDARLADLDAICLVEVIEHLDEDRLPALEAAVFGAARPRLVIVTTPNADYNARFENLPTGRFRHADHRFEWSREEFAAWAEGVATRQGYTVRFEPIGPVDEALGAPTQMGVFSR